MAVFLGGEQNRNFPGSKKNKEQEHPGFKAPGLHVQNRQAWTSKISQGSNGFGLWWDGFVC